MIKKITKWPLARRGSPLDAVAFGSFGICAIKASEVAASRALACKAQRHGPRLLMMSDG